MVCGPTAAGKSELADSLGHELSRACGSWVSTLVVDSMQVYREIPIITNQARGRPAELVGIVPVSEDWTVARHKEKAEALISTLPEDVPFILDGGTGMYVNAILLDIPLAPKVTPQVRAWAEEMAVGMVNPRRAARELELRLLGAGDRGSIWDAAPRYETILFYLRPPRPNLDHNIKVRSSKIARQGLIEAGNLMKSGTMPNPSVSEAIGVKEMFLHISGQISIEEAQVAIATRTRRLARRQIRWFDKLARSLPEGTRTMIVEDAKDLINIQFMI